MSQVVIKHLPLVQQLSQYRIPASISAGSRKTRFAAGVKPDVGIPGQILLTPNPTELTVTDGDKDKRLAVIVAKYPSTRTDRLASTRYGRQSQEIKRQILNEVRESLPPGSKVEATSINVTQPNSWSRVEMELLISYPKKGQSWLVGIGDDMKVFAWLLKPGTQKVADALESLKGEIIGNQLLVQADPEEIAFIDKKYKPIKPYWDSGHISAEHHFYITQEHYVKGEIIDRRPRSNKILNLKTWYKIDRSLSPNY